MNMISQEILKKRLGWIKEARDGLLRALGSDVVFPNVTASPTVDPLKVIISIHLVRALSKNNREPLRTYLRCWAREWDCEISRIPITDRLIRAEVLLKRRHIPRDRYGRFTGGKE